MGLVVPSYYKKKDIPNGFMIERDHLDNGRKLKKKCCFKWGFNYQYLYARA